MPTLIVASCGTSLLNYQAHLYTATDLRDLLKRTSNSSDSDLSTEEKRHIDRWLSQQRERLLGEPLEVARQMSAELNGVLSYYGRNYNLREKNEHLFICSDTYQGLLSAQLLVDWCVQNGMKAAYQKIDRLNTKSVDDFHEAMLHLIHWCQTTLPAYQEAGFTIAFSLVGGFKGLHGYMQTLGMLYADEITYIFEGSQDLIRIPRLPLDVDAASREVMGTHTALFRRLAVSPLPLKICRPLPEAMLFRLDNECELSEWGQLLWGTYKPTLYRSQLLPPPSGKIQYGKAFVKQVEQLDGHALALVNERIDDLLRFLEHHDNLNRFSLKAIYGNPVPDCTHEFYLWSDGNAARAFGRFKKDTFIIETMGDHL